VTTITVTKMTMMMTTLMPAEASGLAHQFH